MSRVDDMWSALFVIIDFSTNALPWKDYYGILHTEDMHRVRRDRIHDKKKDFIEAEFPSHLPTEYRQIMDLLSHV